MIFWVLTGKDPAVSETKKPAAHAKKTRYITPLTRVLVQEKEVS